MKQIFFTAAVFFSIIVQGQKASFQSAQTYTKVQLEAFYASITIQQNLLLFNAPDYNLYAYDKKTGALKWTTRLGWKSNTPPFFVQDYILANNSKEKVVQLDTAAGKLVKELPFYNIASQPLVRDGVLYTTAIYDAGNLLAYDGQKDSVLWYRFLAHGYERAPYYQADRIWANAEGSTWLELDYKGQDKTSACNHTEADETMSKRCPHAFAAFTHDGKKIGGKLAEKMNLPDFEPADIQYATHATLLLADGVLYTIGNRLKLKASKPLQSFLPQNEKEDFSGGQRLLTVTGDVAWLLYNNRVFGYDYKRKRLQKTIDLTAWEPHQPLLDEGNIWFVSRKDGLLYCVPVLQDL